MEILYIIAELIVARGTFCISQFYRVCYIQLYYSRDALFVILNIVNHYTLHIFLKGNFTSIGYDDTVFMKVNDGRMQQHN